MKKHFIVLIALLATLAFVSLSCEKENTIKVSGKIVTYNKGDNKITVKAPRGRQYNFEIADYAEIKGDVVKDGEATVKYKIEGTKMIVVSIDAAPPKKR